MQNSLTLFQRQVIYVSLILKRSGVSFDAQVAWTPWANQHQTMSCFDGNLVPVSRPKSSMPQNILSTETWQLSGPTWHRMFWCPSKETPKTYHPSKHVKFWWATQHKFRFWSNLSLETYRPPKHVKFWELCFGAMDPCSMQNPFMPHP